MGELNTSGVNPLDLRVVVKPDSAITKTAGGIILPDQERDRLRYATTKGTLVAVGENAFEEAAARCKTFSRPSPGDRVLFGQYQGHKFKGPDDEDYLIMNDEDVLGKLEE